MLATILFRIIILSKNLRIKIYKTLILLVVLYGCETWSVILREEQRFKVSENNTEQNIQT